MSSSSSSGNCIEQNTSSPVWAYVSVKVDEEGKATDDRVVICHVCNMAVKARGSNTSNLVSHKVHHPLKHMEVVKKQELKKRGSNSKSVSPGQTTISCAFESARKYERGGKKYESGGKKWN